MRRVLGLAGAMLLCAAPALAENAELEARIARIEQGLVPAVQVRGRDYAPTSLVDAMRTHHVPAVSIALVNDGRIEWARGYGLADPASGRAATPETLFQAASISKPLAAMAALDLVEQDVLALDEPVNARLAGWKIPENDFTDKAPVTLRHLLSHAAGLTVHGFPGYAETAARPTVEQILDGAPPANTGPVRVDQRPGQAMRYSGGGFTVLQLLMTDVTGEPFPALMAAHVLRPLGMTDSTYEQPLPAALHDRAATGHRADGTPVPGLYHIYPEMAAAGLWTTPSDLARWVIALADAYAGRCERVLDQATAAAMLTPGLDGWGLGLVVSTEGDTLRFSHSGGNEGFRAQMIGLADRRQGIVVMTNGDAGGEVFAPLIQAVAAEYDWPGHEARIIDRVAVDSELLHELAGRYMVEDEMVSVTVSPAGDALLLVTSDGQTIELIPQGSDDFVTIPGGGPIAFRRDASGAVTGMQAGPTKLERIAEPAAPAAPAR